MAILNKWNIIKAVFLALFFIPVMSSALVVNITNAISQSVKGTTITDIAVAPIVNSNAIQVQVKTQAGQKNLTVATNQASAALNALRNPAVAGPQNAVIANRIINSKPNLLEIAISGIRVRLPVPGAAAIVSTTAVSANQQASQTRR